jgi:hypothetical protein
MLEMENFNQSWGIIDAVVDEDRRMHQLPNVGPSLYRATDKREPLEDLNVVQNSLAKALGTEGKGGPGIREDIFEIR